MNYLKFAIKDVIERETGQVIQKNKLKVCPFCGSGSKRNKTSAFTIYPETNSFHCFACGAGTYPVSFIAQLHKLSNTESYNYLKTNYYGKNEY